MHKKEKTKEKKTLIISGLIMLLAGCVSPDAVKTEIQGVKNDFSRLEKIVDQKADNKVVADSIDTVNNKIEQTTKIADELALWKNNIQADTINYGGAGWVVIGTGVVVLIFVGSGLILVRGFLRRGTMLKLLTTAIQDAGTNAPNSVVAIKHHLKECVKLREFDEKDRQALHSFVKRKGTYAKQKSGAEV